MSNTSNLEGYTVFSSVSLNGSGATLLATDIVASTISGTGTSKYAVLSASTVSGAAHTAQSGSAIAPTYTFLSDASLGLYKSASSVLALSYGTFDLGTGNLAFSSGTTAQSASTTKVGQGQMIFSILSLTTNGAALYYRSGNSTYVWPSSGVIG